MSSTLRLIAIDIAAEIAKTFEGFSSIPYLCPAGFWTIGYGHRCSKDHQSITRAEATALLRKDLEIAAIAALRWCPILASEPPYKLAAVIDWTFNLGSGRLRGSTFRRRINEGNWISAALECRRWVHSGSKVLKGLVRRRAQEVKLLLLDRPEMAQQLSRGRH